MSYHQTRSVESKYTNCAQEDCPAKCDNHYWGRVDAGKKGWFFRKDGTAWCPAHIPAWVEAWRQNKKLRLKRANA